MRFALEVTRILLFDKPAPWPNLLSALLEEGRPPAAIVTSFTELTRKMRASNSPLVVAIVISPNELSTLHPLLREIDRLNCSASGTYIRPLVLLLDQAPPAQVDQIRQYGASVLLRRYADVVLNEIRLLRWQLEHSESRTVAFRLHYLDATSLRVFLVGRLLDAQLAAGGRMLDLFEFMALNPNWHTRRQIAEGTDIPERQVKVYFGRLRAAFMASRRMAGVETGPRSVFQTKKANGAWLYRLHATILK